MEIRYRSATFIYDLLDVIYFRNKQRSPRTVLSGFISNPAARVLDVCAGTGSNSLLIAQRYPNAQITALDSSENMLKIADSKFHKAGVGNAETVVADACDTGYDDNTFDVVILSLVLHELDSDLQRAMLTESKRVLRDDGRILILEWEQPQKLFQRLKFSLLKLVEPAEFKCFLQKDLSEYFRSFGLIVLEKQSCDYSPVLVLSKRA